MVHVKTIFCANSFSFPKLFCIFATPPEMYGIKLDIDDQTGK